MSLQREDLKPLFKKYCDWQSHNNRGTQIGIYSIAVIGVTVALRRVRPFTKFTRPQQIPNSYILKRREINGKVIRIEPSGIGAVLMVNHVPLINVPGFNTNGETLPVKIANVHISGLGVNWLQSIAVGKQATFVPLSKFPQYLLCEVNITQIGNKKRQQTIDLGESLINIGFGKFEQSPVRVNDLMYGIYIDKLKYAEERYIKRQMGLKYYIESMKVLLLSTLRLITQYSIIKMYKFIASKMPASKVNANKIGKQLPVSTLKMD